MSLGAALVAIFASSEARADPQVSAGITGGIAGRGYGTELFYEPAFELGVMSDLIFGRGGERDVGVGPYVSFMTVGFDDVQFGGGASLVLPVADSIPFVVSVGPYGRYAPLVGLEPGISTSLFFGSRSYNFSSTYVMALGLLVDARVGLGSSHETAFIFGVRVDAAFAGLPFVYLADAIRGGSRETDRVPR